MAVQVILEFTDAQWVLVQEHYPFYAPRYVNDAFTGVEKEIVTEATLAASLYTRIQDLVIKCAQEAVREAAVQDQGNLFDV